LAFIVAVTKSGSSVGTGVAEGTRLATAVGDGSSSSSITFVGGTVTSVGSSLTGVAEGTGVGLVVRSGILQAPRSKAANVSKRKVLLV
jgi:hypothetical protein